MMLTGSEIICECLIEQGVDTVFGYPGGTILNVYDALYRYQDKINHVLTSHEQGASHAADGYARATGKVGVCMATSGPGATNLVTGIATAYMDSTPLVAITANVGVEILGRDSFQEIDITGVTMPITKHNFIVKDIKDLVPTIRKAFYIAKEGRPGPVLVDVTKNVTAEKMEFEPLQPKAIEPKTETYTVEDLDKAIEMIKESEKPFIFAGGGVISSGASQELKEFAEKIDAPVCETLMGKGAFDNTRPRYTGMLGMHGTKASNFGVSQCDLLITVGARRPRGRPHRRLHRGGPHPDPGQPGVPDAPLRLSQHHLRPGDRGRVQRTAGPQPRLLRVRGHRGQPPRVPVLRPGLQGHRLPHRQGGRQGGPGLHPGRDPQRRDRQDHRLLRANPGLLRAQAAPPAL